MASGVEEQEGIELFKAQLRATLNVIPAYTWYAVPSGALTFVNERTANYLGLPNDHSLRFGLVTDAAWDSHIPLLHPDDHEETRNVWSTCLRTGCAGQVSFRVRNAEGGYRWFLSRAEPLRGSDGTLLCWVGVNLDVEDEKRAEDTVRKREKELRDVIDSIPATVWSGQPDGSNLYVNRRFIEYSGISAEQAVGSGWQATTHPDDRDLHVRKWLESVATGTPHENEVRFRRSDGQYRWHLDRAAPLRDEHGDIVRWYGVLTDIDARKQAEEMLSQQELELRHVLDFAPQIVAVFGAKRERIYANGVALDYFGTTLEEWRQRSIGTETHPDDAERAQAAAERALSSRSPCEFEVRLRKRDGTYRWFVARLNPVCDDRGTPTRWYLACTDIDDRKKDEERLRQENAALREEIDQASMFEEIVGTSPALRSVLSQLSKVAPSDSTVLITGETGTGKELVARAIHRRSTRSSRPFICVNCAAISRDLVASELFGHEKGAFTGAIQRQIGRFELADRGTIFLDEVGELLPEIQVALLRVLQEREFERVGGRQPISVDVRVIAATNRDLETAVANGSFRQDLFYRLNVFPIKMPPLRERQDDILMLVEYFVQRYAGRVGKSIRSIDRQTLDLLRGYEWPGNIRELQNVIERSVILATNDVLCIDESWLPREAAVPAQHTEYRAPANGEVAPRSELEIIEAALAETRGRVSGPSGAAARLGVPPSTLDHRIKALNINKIQFKFR